MRCSVQDYARLIAETCSDKAGGELDRGIAEVLELMRARGDGHLIGRLERELADALDASEGGKVKLITASDGSSLRESVARATGKHIEDIEHVQDESLIGGAVVRLGNTVIDASVKGRLEQLKNHLTQ